MPPLSVKLVVLMPLTLVVVAMLFVVSGSIRAGVCDSNDHVLLKVVAFYIMGLSVVALRDSKES